MHTHIIYYVLEFTKLLEHTQSAYYTPNGYGDDDEQAATKLLEQLVMQCAVSMHSIATPQAPHGAYQWRSMAWSDWEASQAERIVNGSPSVAAGRSKWKCRPRRRRLTTGAAISSSSPIM